MLPVLGVSMQTTSIGNTPARHCLDHALRLYRPSRSPVCLSRRACNRACRPFQLPTDDGRSVITFVAPGWVRQHVTIPSASHYPSAFDWLGSALQRTRWGSEQARMKRFLKQLHIRPLIVTAVAHRLGFCKDATDVSLLGERCGPWQRRRRFLECESGRAELWVGRSAGSIACLLSALLADRSSRIFIVGCGWGSVGFPPPPAGTPAIFGARRVDTNGLCVASTSMRGCGRQSQAPHMARTPGSTGACEAHHRRSESTNSAPGATPCGGSCPIPSASCRSWAAYIAGCRVPLGPDWRRIL